MTCLLLLFLLLGSAAAFTPPLVAVNRSPLQRGRPVLSASPATHPDRGMNLRGGGDHATASGVVPLGRDAHFESGGEMVAGFLVAPTEASSEGGGVDGAAAGGILMLTDVFGVGDAHNRAWMHSLCVATGAHVWAVFDTYLVFFLATIPP